VKDSTKCETLVLAGESCLNDDKTLCLDWSNIWFAILMLNSLQLIFESSMAYSLEISLQPTELDRLDNNIEDTEDQVNTDKPVELNC